MQSRSVSCTKLGGDSSVSVSSNACAVDSTPATSRSCNVGPCGVPTPVTTYARAYVSFRLKYNSVSGVADDIDAQLLAVIKAALRFESAQCQVNSVAVAHHWTTTATPNGRRRRLLEELPPASGMALIVDVSFMPANAQDDSAARAVAALLAQLACIADVDEASCMTAAASQSGLASTLEGSSPGGAALMSQVVAGSATAQMGATTATTTLYPDSQNGNDTSASAWYQEAWVWLVGGIVVVVLLAAIIFACMRARRSRNAKMHLSRMAMTTADGLELQHRAHDRDVMGVASANGDAYAAGHPFADVPAEQLGNAARIDKLDNDF